MWGGLWVVWGCHGRSGAGYGTGGIIGWAAWGLEEGGTSASDGPCGQRAVRRRTAAWGHLGGEASKQGILLRWMDWPCKYLTVSSWVR